MTEGTLRDCILFNNNKEIIVHNSTGEDTPDEILWLDLKTQESKWTEQLNGVSNIFKIGESNFGISVDVMNKDGGVGTLLLLCNFNVRIFFLENFIGFALFPFFPLNGK